MRLIDADRLLKVLSKYEDDLSNFKSEYEYGLMQMLETIGYEVEDAPTIEAVPVVHGEWREAAYGFWQCTACCFTSEAHTAKIRYKFCPICGARMDGR